MNKQQLANRIWESANKMRSKIEANEYKDYILGFIFYKFLSDKEEKYLLDLGYTRDDFDTVTEDDEETVDNVRQNLGYFISFENLFSTWLRLGPDFNVANVRDALSAFDRLIHPHHKKVFDRIFDTLSTGLSKLGDTSGAQTRAIRDLILLIRDIPMDGRQDYDVLGFIYEYLISNFAANAGKKAGEFYTPHEVSLLMSEIVADHLKNRDHIEIYDPTSGSGSLLINIGRSVSKYTADADSIKYYAQELKENTYNLTRMNLVMRGILPSNIYTRNGDTLEEDWPYFDEDDPSGTYRPLRVDAVVSNPPYSQQWVPGEESDPRYRDYGLAPKGKADYAFLLHDLYHIRPDGIMAIVLPHGVLFRGGEEGTIRKNLIENKNIETIIGLPANIFFGTGIPTIIMVLKQQRDDTDVLIIDASRGYEKVGKNNKLRASDIKRIVDTVAARKPVANYAVVVSREDIRKNDYNLNIPRYVNSHEKHENWDIYASMYGGIPAEEADELAEYWATFPGLKEALFTDISKPYLQLASPENISLIIREHEAVKSFARAYAKAFEDLGERLSVRLIGGIDEVEISKDEQEIADEIFDKLQGFFLIDPYEVYQILDDEWTQISSDIEVIQTEGRESVRRVVPHMVTKKKNNKEIEIQEGWIGHILPFELVQSELLKEETETLNALEVRLSELPSEYEELLSQLSEEDKDLTFVNDDKTSFVSAEVKKELKVKQLEKDTLLILKKADIFLSEERELKRQIKDRQLTLQLETKERIEHLNDEEAVLLLKKKWIEPVVSGIMDMPVKAVKALTQAVEAMAKKYDTTLSEVDEEIRTTEADLSRMMADLTGNEYDMKGIEKLQGMLQGK